MAEEPAWERIQKKTFTKWCNNHLNKKYGTDTSVNDIVFDWKDGILLMKLAVALYSQNDKHPEQAISMPNLKPAELKASSRIQQVNNGGKALDLLKTAGVKLRGVAGENLVDGDKIAILGMIWMIILDYASRGFGGSSAEVKKALLAWVNQKTEGYERVNPPSVKNFTSDWRSGLAWCALIHRHRPELLDYNSCLSKSNAENLELAFSVAEQHIGIPRLLDVEDVDTDAADEKSIMTYVMEYFLAFAGEGQKDAAAKQAADWLRFLRELKNMMNDYERRARLLIQFSSDSQGSWSGYDFGTTLEEATAAFTALRYFVGTKKPPQEVEKMDVEALFAEIQTLLSQNNLAAYKPPAGLEPEAIQASFDALVAAQNRHGSAVRNNKFRFIEKKEDSGAEETLNQIKESFKHYDENSNGTLNKEEFIAACMEMGVALKTQEDKDNLFNKIGNGGDVTFDQYHDWMKSRMVMKMDDPNSVKACFQAMADGKESISDNNLKINPLTDDDRAYLAENMPRNPDGTYNYNAFVDNMFP